MLTRLRSLGAGIAAVLVLALPALAAPTFPALTGRVVDGANILTPATEASLTQQLEGLETSTGRQLVVVTLPSLQGYEIEEYGYQLGRKWGIGSKDENDGALLIVAPNERKVRIEVGYGLEPVLTDALSSVILQQSVLPKFRDGQMEAGVVAGAQAIVAQLALPDDQAKAVVDRATRASSQAEPKVPPLVVLLIFFFLVTMLRGMFGRRGRRGGLGAALPWIILSGLSSSSGRGGGWSGGGGFSGGGGSFGGGGSSGSW